MRRASYALLLLTGCHAPAPLTPLPVVDRFAVEYRGTIAPVRSPERGLEPDPDQAEPAGASDVRIRSHLVDLPLAAARELLPDLGAPTVPTLDAATGEREEDLPGRGLRVAPDGLREAIADVQRTRDAVLVGAPEVLCADGRQTQMRSGSRQSYVRSFRVLPATESFVADPVVDQAHEGYVLTFVPTLAPDRRGLELELAFEFRDLVAPLPVVGMPFGSGDLLLHVPVEMRQHVRAAVRLGARDAFVLPVKSGRKDRVVLAFVEVEVVDVARAVER
jgi:hypothetical protein